MVKQAACIMPKAKAGQTAWVMKNAPIVTSDTLRDIPCDRCRKVGRPCLPWMKGGQALSTCATCYGLKISCKTRVGAVTSRNEAEGQEAIGTVDEETKVHGQEGTTGETEEKPGRACRPPRSAAVQAQACLEKYCKPYASERDLADADIVPASVLIRKKCPLANVQPASQK